MHSGLKIERVMVSDHAAIFVLLQKVGLPPDGIEDHLKDFLIIRHPEAAAGPEFLIGSIGIEVYGDSALLRSLAIHPDYQGRGLGTKLINGVIEVAKNRGITRLFLLTDTAEEYFKKKGFINVNRDQVPIDMKQSVEFTNLCNSSPSLMLEI